MVNLGPIDFKLGLPLNIDVNDHGQNKFKVNISKTVAKKANFRPEIGQDATFAPALNGHNSVISYPILTSDHTKIISSSGRIKWFKTLSSISYDLFFGFCPIFLLRGTWTRNHPQVVGTCPGHHLKGLDPVKERVVHAITSKVIRKDR